MKKTLLALSLFVFSLLAFANEGIDVYSTSNGYDRTFSFTTEANVSISINFHNDGLSTISSVWAEGGDATIYALEGTVKDVNNITGTDALYSFVTNVNPLNQDLVSGTFLESEWWDFTDGYGDQTFEVKIYDVYNNQLFECYVDFINDFLGTPGVTQVSWSSSN